MKYKKIKFIVNQIKENQKVLDVGTDHCLVPIFLKTKYKNILVHASEINPKPLEIAKKNLSSKKIDGVKLFLMNGIEDIDPNFYDIIIISGMGGKTISEIISKKQFLGSYILHPTNEISFLRKEIENLGMNIIDEYIVKENNFFNIIIKTNFEKTKFSEKELFLGPKIIKNKNLNYRDEYFAFLLSKFEKIQKLSNNYDLYSKEINWIKES